LSLPTRWSILATCEILRGIANALKPAGRAIFTLERLAADQTDEVRLNPSGRYAHSPAHVVECLAGTGLEIAVCAEEILRKESGRPVQGLLIEARKPAEGS
jgi:predicted TPR repeat methyltransferase